MSVLFPELLFLGRGKVNQRTAKGLSTGCQSVTPRSDNGPYIVFLLLIVCGGRGRVGGEGSIKERHRRPRELNQRGRRDAPEVTEASLALHDHSSPGH